MIVRRIEGETEQQFIKRVCQSKDSFGTWQDIAEFLNSELGYKYSESTYRKKYGKHPMANDPKTNLSEDADSIGVPVADDTDLDIDKERQIEQKRIQLRDERTEYNKQNRIQARVERKLDYLEQQLMKQGKVNFMSVAPRNIESECDMLVCLSDLHIGQCFNSAFGKYDVNTAKSRLEQYLGEIKRIQELHKCQSCYVSIQGDLISGNIHKTVAVSNMENVIEQIKTASELITSFCYELTKIFQNVYMTNCSGNHSRIDRKDEALHDERLDDLVGWNVSKCLSHITNFHTECVNALKVDIGIARLTIRGKTYLACHGDYDEFSFKGATSLSMMLGFIPYAILCGHRHFPAISDFAGIQMIQCGSLAGSGDNYCIEKRLTGKPSQTVCICTSKGVQCYYPIELK
ncbi:MAG: hypothetical protein NC244_07835 [Alistipes senegalensis]|nr:hypothetical protein [Alistipes senegalensis]